MNLLSELLKDRKKPTHPYKRQTKKTTTVANAASANELIAELNEQIANLEEAQADHHHASDDEDDMLILGSTCHPSNVPDSNSPTVPLSPPTTTLNANNSVCEYNHKKTLKISDKIRVKALVTPALSSRLLSVHDIAKRASLVIFTRNKAFIIGKNNLEATASWRNPFYKADRTKRAQEFITKKQKSPPKPLESVHSRSTSKNNSRHTRTLVLHQNRIASQPV